MSAKKRRRRPPQHFNPAPMFGLRAPRAWWWKALYQFPPVTETIRAGDIAAGCITADKLVAGVIPDPDGSLLRMTNEFVRDLRALR
jgi:hypothetical protein